MAKVRYVGPLVAVEVVLPNGLVTPPVSRGQVLDTTAEHARSLLEQESNWAAVKAEKDSK